LICDHSFDLDRNSSTCTQWCCKINWNRTKTRSRWQNRRISSSIGFRFFLFLLLLFLFRIN